MTLQVWKYANNGVISDDGHAQLSGVDRDHYLVRFGAELALITCENFTTDQTSKTAIHISRPMQWITAHGPRDVTDNDREQLRAFLTIAMPAMGRDPIFE